MNDSTPMSPLARTVLTRIHATPAASRVWRRRALLCVIAVGAIAAFAWAARRQRETMQVAAPSSSPQVRPAIPMTPALRVGAAGATSTSPNTSSAPSSTSR